MTYYTSRTSTVVETVP